MARLFRKRIGVFGSGFDPPHAGHLSVVHQALTRCDEVWLVPSARHAFGKQMAPWATRLAMLEALAKGSGAGERLRIEPIEVALASASDQPVYTFHLLEALQARVAPSCELVLVVGPDNADPATWRRWYRHEELTERYRILVADSAGPMRSSKIRSALARGESPPKGWISPGVLAVIEQSDWYKAGAVV